MDVNDPSLEDPLRKEPEPPRTRRALEKRRQVMSAAARLISEKGYHETSMRDIAAELGMSAASLYHYFPGKEDLVVALQRECFEELLRRSHERLRDLQSPTDRLFAFVSNHMTYVVDNIALLRVLVHEDARLSKDNREAMRTYKREYVELAKDLIQAVPREPGAPAIDDRIVVFALFGMMNWYYKWYHRATDLSGHEIAEGLTQLFLRGFVSAGRAVPQVV